MKGRRERRGGRRAGKGEAIFAVCPLESRCTFSGRAQQPVVRQYREYPGREAWRGRGGEKILESKTEELNFQRRGAQRVCGAPLRRAARSAPVAHAAPVERDLHTRNACTRARPSVSVHAATRVHA